MIQREHNDYYDIKRYKCIFVRSVGGHLTSRHKTVLCVTASSDAVTKPNLMYVLPSTVYHQKQSTQLMQTERAPRLNYTGVPLNDRIKTKKKKKKKKKKQKRERELSLIHISEPTRPP